MGGASRPVILGDRRPGPLLPSLFLWDFLFLSVKWGCVAGHGGSLFGISTLNCSFWVNSLLGYRVGVGWGDMLGCLQDSSMVLYYSLLRLFSVYAHASVLTHMCRSAQLEARGQLVEVCSLLPSIIRYSGVELRQNSNCLIH